MAEHDLTTAWRTASLLEVLAQTFKGNVRGSLDEFDMKIRRYERSCKEVLPDRVKIAVVQMYLEDNDLRRHLLAASSLKRTVHWHEQEMCFSWAGGARYVTELAIFPTKKFTLFFFTSTVASTFTNQSRFFSTCCMIGVLLCRVRVVCLSSRSSSAMVTTLLLTPTAPFLSHLALSNFSSTSFTLALPPHIFPQLDPSHCGFRWGADAMAFSLVDTLRLRRHEHTFVAFIDIKKAFDSCWVEATLVRLFDFGVTGSLWHLLANFLCGTLSQVRLGGSVSSPGSTLASRKAEFFLPLLFNLLIYSLAVTFRSAVPRVSLATSDSFRHACQLCADDLVVLTASQADLQLALDAVHAWGVRWRFSFGVGPTKSATMVFGLLHGRPDCCVLLGGVPLPWFSSTIIWALSFHPLSLGALTSTFFVPEGIVFFTRPVLGALVKVSLSPSPPMAFP